LPGSDKMDLSLAKNILGVTENISVEKLQEIFNNKKAGLLSKDFSGLDVSVELDALEDAFNTIYKEIKEKGDSSNSLVTQQAIHENVIQATNFAWNDKQVKPLLSAICPQCGGLIPEGAVVCDLCQTQIARPCPSCGNIIRLDARVCKRCGTPIQEFDRKRFANALATEQRINQERVEEEINNKEIEAGNSRFIARGVLIWSIIVMIIIGFCVIAFLLLRNMLLSYG